MKPAVQRQAVYIKWEDPACKSAWMDLEQAKKCPTGIIETVAWLIDQTPTHIRFSCAVDFDDNTIGDVWTLPRTAIKKMKRIKDV